MTRDVWPISGLCVNVLALACLFTSSLGNRGYASWVPKWFPGPWTMMVFVLPGIGVFCTVVSWVVWRKHKGALPNDYANWARAAIASGACLVSIHGWMWIRMRLL